MATRGKICVLGLSPLRQPSRKLASGVHPVMSSAAVSTDLPRWVKEQGGFVWSGLHLMQRGVQGMELLALQSVPKGTTIIALPRKLPLAMEASSDDPRDLALLELAQPIPEELWALRLGMKLLSERAKRGSFWWPYISLLPQTFTLPMFFPGPDIESIDYVPLSHQVKKRCKFLMSFTTQLSEALSLLPEDRHPFGGQKVDSGALGWAMAAVSSRAFRTHNVCSAMMLPLIDMCNHSFTPNARIVEDSSKEAAETSFLKVVTDMDIKEGDPITINYGSLSNDLLLLDYGFVLPDNPHDYIELRYDGALLEHARLLAGLSEPENTLLNPFPWQHELVKKLGLCETGKPEMVTLGGASCVDGRLLAALRILYSKDVPRDPPDLESLKSWPGMLGVDNEKNVVRTLCVVAAIVLSHFKSSVVEDEAQLSSGSLPQSTRLAISFRMSKKKVLLKVLDSLKAKIN